MDANELVIHGSSGINTITDDNFFMSESIRISRYAPLACILLAILFISGCCNIIPGCKPLTPGHRDFEGDIWVMKLDGAGNREWFRVIDTERFDEAREASESPGGGYAIAGSLAGLGEVRSLPRVILLGGDGSLRFDRTYPAPAGSLATGIAEQAEGGFAIACPEGLIIRIDEDGGERWRTPLNSSGRFWSITSTDDGRLAAAGGTTITMLDDDGAILWQTWFGDLNPDTKPLVIADAQGGCLVAGQYSGAYNLATLVRFDGNGNQSWNTTLGGGERRFDTYIPSAIRQNPDTGFSMLAVFTSDSATGVKETRFLQNGAIIDQTLLNASAPITWMTDGGYISASIPENAFLHALLEITRLDETGAVSWTRSYTLDEYCDIVSVIETSDGGCIVLGMYQKF